MLKHPGVAEEPHYHDYLDRRLVQSLARAEQARNARERAVHLRACRFYCDLLNTP